MVTYEKHYQLTDTVITHLNTVIPNIEDDFIASRYVGFVVTAAVTSYEKVVREIFINFAQKKHKALGTFTRTYFDQINGRVKLEHLKKYAAQYGDKYARRFDKKVGKEEVEILKTQKASVVESYGNIIRWRHKFIHEGEIPAEPTYSDAVFSYELGKKLIKCLFEAMQR